MQINEIRPGDIIQPKEYSYWLLKIDGANKKSLGEGKGLGKIEYAYYLLAKEAGIEMSEGNCILRMEFGVPETVYLGIGYCF